MSFVRQNLLSGALSATLGSGATSMSSAELAALVAIAAPGRARLVLDPSGIHGTPEIVDVVAHDANGATATIVREVEDADRFPAREHPAGTVWHLADTVESTGLSSIVVVDSPTPVARPDAAIVLWLDDATNAVAGDWRPAQ